MKDFRVYLLTIIIIFAVILTTAACTAVAATPVPTTVPTATAAPTMESGDIMRKLTVNNVERSYLLYIPPGLEASQPVPALFVFHGADERPEDIRASTGFNDIADKAGFLVVYPNGMEHTWNAGKGFGYAADNNVDDIAFVRQIVSDLGMVATLDSKRIYATGFSNGGGLVYRLGCEMSDVFAGIAPVAAAPLVWPCQPKQPISLIHVQGLADDFIPFEGGGPFDIPPIKILMATWAKFDGCSDSPTEDHPVKIVTHIAYSSCKAGTGVELYAIEFGGHAWQSFSAWSGSQAIWEFFAAHPKSS